MKPDRSNLILVNYKVGDHDVVEAYEAGSKIDSTVLNRLLQYAMHNNLNLLYQVDGGWNAIGLPEFMADHGTIYHRHPKTKFITSYGPSTPKNEVDNTVAAASDSDVLTP